MLDQAFDALKQYNWGPDRKNLDPIRESVVSTHGDAAARNQLERRLVEVLQSDVTRAAKDFICRQLMVIGTATSVPALAALLSRPEDSHMARYALERIPAPEAARALLEALPELRGPLKVGVIASLGVRGESSSIASLAALLNDADVAVARAAAVALGAIHSPQAVKALAAARPKSAEVKVAATDASLTCAEALLADGKPTDALRIYKSMSGGDQPKHVRLAATRGMLACAGKGG